MDMLKVGTTSPMNGANYIDQNGHNFSMKFKNMRQSTWNGPTKSLEIGEVLNLIQEYWRISLNWPIRLIKISESYREVI